MSFQGACSTQLTESAMVLVVYWQMPARLVAVSKRKRHHVAGAPVLRWRSSSCVAWSSTCCIVTPPVGPALTSWSPV